MQAMLAEGRQISFLLKAAPALADADLRRSNSFPYVRPNMARPRSKIEVMFVEILKCTFNLYYF
ncbi:hypothetical protein CHELA20_50828 [Hyphomicrobiales bacterium]|nr:hypothetical protein CHELA20_50828 [Hyphomicrobiales bacterium]CAH1676007.1 hypothetical protein CHELA41_24189 [Hyphomicrobiales bacterium]